MSRTPENTIIVNGEVVAKPRALGSTRVPIAEQLGQRPKTQRKHAGSTRRSSEGIETLKAKQASSPRKASTRGSTRQSTSGNTDKYTGNPNAVKTKAFKNKTEDHWLIRNAKTVFLFAAAILLFAIGYVLLSSGQEPLQTGEPTEQTGSPNTSTNTGILRSPSGD